jgi:hypothetical protein
MRELFCAFNLCFLYDRNHIVFGILRIERLLMIRMGNFNGNVNGLRV